MNIKSNKTNWILKAAEINVEETQLSDVLKSFYVQLDILKDVLKKYPNPVTIKLINEQIEKVDVAISEIDNIQQQDKIEEKYIVTPE